MIFEVKGSLRKTCFYTQPLMNHRVSHVFQDETSILLAIPYEWAAANTLTCLEGLHNKAFILTMDNRTEVFAQLPNANAGPTQYTTASEVATPAMVR